jgi:hypothetical protein
MFAAADSTIIVSLISLLGVLATTGGLIVVSLIKMKRSNTKDHGEVLTVLRTVVIGQEQLTNVVDRHIDHHDNIQRHQDQPARDTKDV